MTTKTRHKRARAPKRDDPEQSKLFIAKAREHDADENRSDADELLGRLARLPPQPKRKRKK
jgi:hypothetical protein